MRGRRYYRNVIVPPVPQYGPWPLPSIEQTRRWAGSYVAGSLQQIEKVAQYMAATGDCVYHAVAAVFGTPCICQNCRPDIKRYC